MSLSIFLNEIAMESELNNTSMQNSVIFLGQNVRCKYKLRAQEDQSKYASTVPKVIKVAERYMRDNHDTFIKDLQTKYKHWHDDSTISEPDLNKKLIIEVLEISCYKNQNDGKLKWWVELWRKNSPDFFGNHSVNTQIGIIDGKVDEKHTYLIMIEG
jgi:hypothetical protein